jgi:hypothetical protein
VLGREDAARWHAWLLASPNLREAALADARGEVLLPEAFAN